MLSSNPKEVARLEHYYTAEPASEHRVTRVSAMLRGQSLSFVTDSGVFSREAVDFGTRLMVEALPPLSGRVLDLGCGWGALSLPLALAYPGLSLTCVDINRRALALCRENAASLGVKAEILESDGFSAITGAFDAILTNPPIRAGKSVYYPWFEQSFHHLAPGGLFACVVQKKQGAPSVKKELARIYSDCQVMARDAGYWILTAQRR